jgi:hypothetical protein
MQPYEQLTELHTAPGAISSWVNRVQSQDVSPGSPPDVHLLRSSPRSWLAREERAGARAKARATAQAWRKGKTRSAPASVPSARRAHAQAQQPRAGA